MQREAWLSCNILEIVDNKAKVSGRFIDETTFELTVARWDVDTNRNALRVIYQGKNDTKASIVLPAPILEHGHSIVVPYADISF